MKTRLTLPAPLLSSLLCLFSLHASSAEALPAFSSLVPGQALPKDFRVITLPIIAHNKFSLVTDEGKTVLRVESVKSAGSIGIPLTSSRRSRVAAGGNELLEWRWKVNRILEKADLNAKQGDDYAARVYVFFDVPLASLSFAERSKITVARMVAGTEVPTAALCYVWDNKHPVGHTAWSPYTKRVRKIVLQSGTAQVGRWMSEARDVAADFREAFGVEAPAVTSVAVGNDTDNTGDHVTTWFGDVSFRR